MKIVTIEIDLETGESSCDIAGAQGKGCHAVQEAMGKALGRTIGGHTKPEYHKPCDTKTKLQIHE